MYQERRNLYSPEELIASRTRLRQNLAEYFDQQRLSLGEIKEQRKRLEVHLAFDDNNRQCIPQRLLDFVNDLYQGREVAISRIKFDYCPAKYASETVHYSSLTDEEIIVPEKKEPREYELRAEIRVDHEQTELEQSNSIEHYLVDTESNSVVEDTIYIDPDDQSPFNPGPSFKVPFERLDRFLEDRNRIINSSIWGFVEPPILNDLATLIPQNQSSPQPTRSHSIFQTYL